MLKIENKTFPNERDLYGFNDIHLINCAFTGPEDGESALKESSNVKVESCLFDLRYPFWHVDVVEISQCKMTEKCRAALWYSRHIKINNSTLHGVKALRECEDIHIQNSDVLSPEFGWRCKDVKIVDSTLEGEYLLFQTSGICWENVRFKGKYSFQYTNDVKIENCNLDTKDAFWHSKNVTVKNTMIKGEYLGWYSENLTLINCKIIGTQPLCYCRNLKLIDCEMVDADLSFEYSDVDATIKGEILSVKNPKSGSIVADYIKETILTEDSKYKCNCKIIKRSLK